MNLIIALILAAPITPCPALPAKALECEIRTQVTADSAQSDHARFALVSAFSLRTRAVPGSRFGPAAVVQSVEDRGRPRWVIPVIGAVIGGGIGALVASRKSSGGDSFFSLHSLYIPIGAAGGALIGAVVDNERRR